MTTTAELIAAYKAAVIHWVQASTVDGQRKQHLEVVRTEDRLTAALTAATAPPEDWRELRGKMIAAMRRADGMDGHYTTPMREQTYAMCAYAALSVLTTAPPSEGEIDPRGFLPIVLCPTDGVWRMVLLPDGREVVAAFEGGSLGPRVRRWRMKSFGYHHPSAPTGETVGGVEKYSPAYGTFVIEDLPEGVYPTHFRPNDTVWGEATAILRPPAAGGGTETSERPWDALGADRALSRWVLQDFETHGLNEHTAKLIRTFAYALAMKLREAEKKYGYSDGWRTADWEDECRRQIRQHTDKGDPLDVAAYAAFCWARKWSTAGDEAKARHHTISASAALFQWWKAIPASPNGIGVDADLDPDARSVLNSKGQNDG